MVDIAKRLDCAHQRRISSGRPSTPSCTAEIAGHQGINDVRVRVASLAHRIRQLPAVVAAVVAAMVAAMVAAVMAAVMASVTMS